MADGNVVSSVDALKSMEPLQGLDNHLGMKVVEIADGYARLTMDMHENHLNLFGGGHGGALFSLADSAFALACNTRGYLTVASGCSIDYIKPAAVGDRLIAEAQRIETSGKTSIYDVKITNQNDETVAMFRGRAHQTSKLVMEQING